MSVMKCALAGGVLVAALVVVACSDGRGVPVAGPAVSPSAAPIATLPPSGEDWVGAEHNRMLKDAIVEARTAYQANPAAFKSSIAGCKRIDRQLRREAGTIARRSGMSEGDVHALIDYIRASTPQCGGKRGSRLQLVGAYPGSAAAGASFVASLDAERPALESVTAMPEWLLSARQSADALLTDDAQVARAYLSLSRSSYNYWSTTLGDDVGHAPDEELEARAPWWVRGAAADPAACAFAVGIIKNFTSHPHPLVAGCLIGGLVGSAYVAYEAF